MKKREQDRPKQKAQLPRIARERSHRLRDSDPFADCYLPVVWDSHPAPGQLAYRSDLYDCLYRAILCPTARF